MTFLQKYLAAPALGAAGLFVGLRVYRNRVTAKSPAVPPAGETSAELSRLSEQIKQLGARLSAVETKSPGGEWLDTLNSRFVSIEERLSAESNRIAVIEDNYQNIEVSLENILRKLDGLGRERSASPVPIGIAKERLQLPADESPVVAQLVG